MILHENFISSHTKITCYLHMWRDHRRYGYIINHTFFAGVYNKQNITCPLVELNFIFLCSTRYLTRSLHSLVRYRVEHLKIKFISMRRHIISSIYSHELCCIFMSPQGKSKYKQRDLLSNCCSQYNFNEGGTRHLVSSVGRAPVCCAGGRRFEPQFEPQTGPTLRVLK